LTATCPTCGAASPRRFVTHDRNRKVTKEQFSYFTCPACRLVFLQPVPDDLGRYYTSEYYLIPADLAALDAASAFDQYKVDFIERFTQKGRLLEIGPAWGYFAYRAKRAGFDVHAIEMDERCCRFLRDTVGIEAIHSNDPVSAMESLGQFDAIAMWHVVEHLADPWRTLRAAAARLASGGTLVIAAPNPGAFQFRILGKAWTHVDAPRHVNLIPIRLLHEKLTGLGLSLIHVTTRDAGGVFFNHFGWQQSLHNFSGWRPLRFVLRQVGKVISTALIPIERFGLNGSAYTMVFRKTAC
jgi:2-polyprenyl-3-methyl-5-hydroxy-6-metoxy-1,4-benzoquinol methylase